MTDLAAARRKALVPLVVDVAIPLGIYYTAHKGFGLGLVTSLALGGVVPAVRTVAGLVRDRSLNALAALMLAVNAVGISLSFVTGDPRLMIAKDSGISSVIGLVILLSAFRGRPLMTAGLKPFITRGEAGREAAWDRLLVAAPRFRTLERRFSAIWGAALLAECAARTAGAYTIPVETMAWLGTVFLVVALVIAAVVSGGAASEEIKAMVDEESAREPVATPVAA
jgi:hypothetical protein